MRKEVFIAVFLGGALGLAIAFGVWRANLALAPQKAETQKIATSNSSPTPTAGMLIVTEPDDNTLVSTESITLKGKAEPRSAIVITTQADAVSTISEGNGLFSADIKLDSGANVVLVTTVNEQGEEFSTELTITYSTEFKEE